MHSLRQVIKKKEAQTISMISFDTLFEGVSCCIMQQLGKSVEQFDHLPAKLKNTLPNKV